MTDDERLSALLAATPRSMPADFAPPITTLADGIWQCEHGPYQLQINPAEAPDGLTGELTRAMRDFVWTAMELDRLKREHAMLGHILYSHPIPDDIEAPAHA